MATSAAEFLEAQRDRLFRIEQVLRKARQHVAYSDNTANELIVAALGHIEVMARDISERLRKLRGGKIVGLGNGDHEPTES